MSDDGRRFPYRTAEDRPPTSERRSSRVLGALARLSMAHGAAGDSASLSERARLARRVEGESRGLPRCVRGHEALERESYAEAERIYRAWLDLAVTSAHRVRNHLEVLGAHAAVSFVVANRLRGEALLREAVLLARRTGVSSLPPDAPAAATILVAMTFRRLGDQSAASAMLRRASGADLRPLIVGALDQAWAEVRLARGELDAALAHARFAAATRYAALESCSPAHAATRALLGRILLAQGRLAEAEEELLAAGAGLRQSEPHDALVEAEIEAAWGGVLAAQGRALESLAAARRARELVARAASGSTAMTLPALRAVAALLPDSRERTAVAAEIAAIEASYRPA